MATLEGIFVNSLYQNVLFRTPTQAELDAAVSDLTLGTITRDGLRASVLNALEYTTNVGAVVRLFDGILGRQPDVAGMNFWTNALNEALAGLTPGTEEYTAARQSVLVQISNDFSASPEAQESGLAAAVAITDPTDVGQVTTAIESLYTQVLGRASDAAGLQFWVDVITTGQATIGDAIQFFTESAENVAQEIGYVIGYGALRSYDNVQPSQEQLNAFSNDATTNQVLAAAAAVGASDDVPSGPGTITDDPGQGGELIGETFSLTDKLDVLTGTNDNDTFSAAVGTLDGFDTLNGNPGNDSLLASFAPAAGNNLNLSPTISSIETISINNGGAGTTTISFLNTTGLKNLEVAANTGNLTFTDLPAGVEHSLSNFTAAGSVAGYFLLDGSGVEDALDVSFTRVGTANNNAGLSFDNFETLNITTASLPSFANINQAGGATDTLKTITVAGDQNLTLTTPGVNNLTTVDASGLTGNLNLTVNNASNIAITGGAGNDVFNVGNIDANDSIDGGDGTDTFIAAAAAGGTTLTKGSFASIENLAANAAAGFFKADVGAIGVAGLSVTNATNAVTFDNVPAGTPLTFQIVDANADGAEAATAVAYNLQNAAVGTSDSLDVTIDAANVATANPPPAAPITDVKLTANNIETISINSVNTGTSPGSNGLDGFTAAGLKTLTITGDTALRFQVDPLAPTIDASAFTGNLTLGGPAVAIGAATKTVTGGSGNDQFWFNGNLGAGDSVNGGDGTDTLAVADTDFQAAGITVSNIEALLISETDATGNTIDLTKLGNIANVTINDTGGAATTTINGAATGVNVTLQADTGANGKLDLNIGSDTLKDSANLIANDGNPAAVTTVNFGTVDVTPFETLSIDASADKLTIGTLTAPNVNSLTATGGNDITLTGTTAAQLTADFSGTAGDNTFTAAAGSNLTNLTYTGGTGDDTIDVGTNIALTSNIQNINGGVGNDTLTAKFDGIKEGGVTITDVETVNLVSTDAGAAVTGNVLLGSGITSSGQTKVTVNASTEALTLGTKASPLGEGVVQVDASAATVQVDAAFTSGATFIPADVIGPATVRFAADTVNSVAFDYAPSVNYLKLSVTGFTVDDKIDLSGSGIAGVAGFTLDTDAAIAGGDGAEVNIVNSGTGSTVISIDVLDDGMGANDIEITLLGVELGGQLSINGGIITGS